jgi:hypothetical protein
MLRLKAIEKHYFRLGKDEVNILKVKDSSHRNCIPPLPPDTRNCIFLFLST